MSKTLPWNNTLETKKKTMCAVLNASNAPKMYLFSPVTTICASNVPRTIYMNSKPCTRIPSR